MNKIKIILLFSYLLFIALACKKECFPEKKSFTYVPCDVKFDMTSPYPIITDDIPHDSLQYQFPVFNPTNANEIIYQYIDLSLNVWQLKKYNYTTKEQQILVDNCRIGYQPSWSRENYIAYVTNMSVLKLINGNGSIVPFNTGGFSGPAKWLPNGKELVWNCIGENGQDRNLLKKGILQNYFDTILQNPAGLVSISNKNIALFSNMNETVLYYSDLNASHKITYSDIFQIPINIQGVNTGVCWHPDGTKFYVSKLYNLESSGIYEIQFPSGEARKIIQSCDKRFYKSLSCSPKGNFLIGEGVDRYQQFDNQGNFTGKIFENSNIYLINIQTSEEIKLDL